MDEHCLLTGIIYMVFRSIFIREIVRDVAVSDSCKTKAGGGGDDFRQRLASLSKQTKVIPFPARRLASRTKKVSVYIGCIL